MSEPDWEVPPQQPEGIHWRVVIIIVTSALALFAAAVGIESAMQWTQSRQRNPSPSIPGALGQRTINLLEQVPFPIQTEGYRERAEALRRVDGWGWVDRGRGIIHVPVEREMEKLVAEDQARRGRAPGAHGPGAGEGGGGDDRAGRAGAHRE